MRQKSIDFQGMIAFDQRIVDVLKGFLEEKENQLIKQIISHIPGSIEVGSLSLAPFPEVFVKLSETAKEFGLGPHFSIVDEAAIFLQLQESKEKINHALWKFVEIVESSATELFQQISLTSINQWHSSIIQVVLTIKDLILHYIEDVLWMVYRLEKPLLEYEQKLQKPRQNWWKKIFEKPYFDPNIRANLQYTEKFLKLRYEEFFQRYTIYKNLEGKVEAYLEKLSSYPVIARLLLPDRSLYLTIYRFVKMIELNPFPTKEIGTDLAVGLKNFRDADSVLRILSLYYRKCKEALYKYGLDWKQIHLAPERENLETRKRKLQEELQDGYKELQQFIHTMGRYRLFFLKQSGDPYSNSWFGFSEWIAGPEKVESKKILNLLYSAEELRRHWVKLLDALVKIPETSPGEREEIEDLLHQMGQPLISRGVLLKRAEQLLHRLQACDELSNPDFSIIDYFQKVLAKAMRLDWKYHVLHEFPLFHRLYEIHLGLVGSDKDSGHVYRLEHFHLLLDQIKEWVEAEGGYMHKEEIQIDMNDIKTYLQEFLASVQRAVQEIEKNVIPVDTNETCKKLYQELLEYRYLFGQFFASIKTTKQEGILLRNQFLFVDHYFETSENLLT